MHDLLEAALLGVDALPPAQPRRRAGRVDHERVELLTDLKAADGYAQHIAAASRREMEGGDRVDAGTGRAAFVRGQQRVDAVLQQSSRGNRHRALAQQTGARSPRFFTIALCVVIPLAQGLSPNSNTIAMTPLPHVAGTASAIIATVTAAGGALLGGLASDAFDGTVRPFAVYVLIFMSLAAICILWGTAKSKPRPSSKPE